MNFKKYSTSDNQWHDIPYYQHKTATDTLTLPAVLYPNDTSITVGLKGNEEHTGIPTPSSPVMPQGTGERTGNLFDKVFASGYNIASDGYPIPYTPDNSRCATLEAIDVSNQNTVTFSYTNTVSDNKWFIYSLFNGNTLVVREPNKSSGTTIDVSQGNKLYLCVYSNLASVNAAETTTKIMLNEGSTALPYEPFGVKIPISSADTTTPVYLGEVETTRKIGKLVLTGEEEYMQYGGGTGIGLRITVEDMRIPSSVAQRTNGYCTHFVPAAAPSGATGDNITFGTSSNIIYIILSVASQQAFNVTTHDEFKAWIAAQYAAGTPVTIWYVLATPETGIVNEPLRKIGTYADTISGISIPTTAGANAVDVLTTLKPSEVTATYRGWHPVQSVHKRENGVWD